MARIEFLIAGLSPLLVHNPRSMQAAAGAKAGKGKQIPTAEEEAEQSTYRDEAGHFLFPVIGPRNAMLKAAKKFRIKGKRGSLFDDFAHIQPEQEFAVILNGTKPAKKYEIDTRRAVVQRNGVLRSRARFDLPWHLRFAMLYDAELIKQPELMRQVLEDAGNRIGIGDYRPVCWGWFGRFSVIEMKA